MARRWFGGHELSTNTNAVEWTTTFGTPDIPSVNKRSGGYAVGINTLSSGTPKGVAFQLVSADNDGPFFYRAYLKVNTRPSAENRIMSSGGSITAGTDNRWYITLDSGGLLRLYDEDGAIGSASSALLLGRWYRIEVQFDSTAADGSHVVRAKIDGTEFAGASNRTVPSGVFAWHLGGNIASEAQTTGEWFFDDFAVNDSTGSFQTSYPGPGEVIFLRPNAAGDATAWTNDYLSVDEVTPDDATTLVATSTLNAEDLHNIEAIPLVMDTTDTINCVAVGVRFRTSTAATSPSFKLEIEATAAGTIEQSAEITSTASSWKTNANAAPSNYALVLYDMPGASTTAITPADLGTFQIGYKETTDQATTVQISTVWLAVEHTPNLPPTTVLNSPADASSGSDTTPTLDFTGTDPESNDIRYEVQIGTSSSFDPVVDAFSDSGAIASDNEYSWNHTVASQSNRVLAVIVNCRDNDNPTNRPVTGVTADGVAMTLAKAKSSTDADGDDTRSEIWLLDAPNTGTISIVVTHTGTVDFAGAGAISIYNAKQTTTPNTTGEDEDTQSTATTDPDCSMTTTVNNCILIDAVYNQTGAQIDPAGGQTQIFSLATNGSGDKAVASYKIVGIAGTYSMGWVTATKDAFSAASIAIEPFVSTSFAKVSGTDSGFANPDVGGDTDPFTSGDNIQFTVQGADALSAGTYHWRARGKDPSGANYYGAWPTARSFTITSGGTVKDIIGMGFIPFAR